MCWGSATGRWDEPPKYTWRQFGQCAKGGSSTMHATFTVKEHIFLGQATAAHHRATHTLFSAYRHASMAAICSHATFLLGRHWQQIFDAYQREQHRVQH